MMANQNIIEQEMPFAFLKQGISKCLQRYHDIAMGITEPPKQLVSHNAIMKLCFKCEIYVNNRKKITKRVFRSRIQKRRFKFLILHGILKVVLAKYKRRVLSLTKIVFNSSFLTFKYTAADFPHLDVKFAVQQINEEKGSRVQQINGSTTPSQSPEEPGQPEILLIHNPETLPTNASPSSMPLIRENVPTNLNEHSSDIVTDKLILRQAQSQVEPTIAQIAQTTEFLNENVPENRHQNEIEHHFHNSPDKAESNNLIENMIDENQDIHTHIVFQSQQHEIKCSSPNDVELLALNRNMIVSAEVHPVPSRFLDENIQFERFERIERELHEMEFPHEDIPNNHEATTEIFYPNADATMIGKMCAAPTQRAVTVTIPTPEVHNENIPDDDVDIIKTVRTEITTPEIPHQEDKIIELLPLIASTEKNAVAKKSVDDSILIMDQSVQVESPIDKTYIVTNAKEGISEEPPKETSRKRMYQAPQLKDVLRFTSPTKKKRRSRDNKFKYTKIYLKRKLNQKHDEKAVMTPAERIEERSKYRLDILDSQILCDFTIAWNIQDLLEVQKHDFNFLDIPKEDFNDVDSEIRLDELDIDCWSLENYKPKDHQNRPFDEADENLMIVLKDYAKSVGNTSLYVDAINHLRSKRRSLVLLKKKSRVLANSVLRLCEHHNVQMNDFHKYRQSTQGHFELLGDRPSPIFVYQNTESRIDQSGNLQVPIENEHHTDLRFSLCDHATPMRLDSSNIQLPDIGVPEIVKETRHNELLIVQPESEAVPVSNDEIVEQRNEMDTITTNQNIYQDVNVDWVGFYDPDDDEMTAYRNRRRMEKLSKVEVIQIICNATKPEKGYIRLTELIPPRTKRMKAAKIFAHLLRLHAEKLILLETDTSKTFTESVLIYPVKE